MSGIVYRKKGRRPARSYPYSDRKSRKLVTKATVKKMIGSTAEKKIYPLPANPITLDVAGSWTKLSLFAPVQGIADNQRIGDSVHAKNLSFNYTIKPHSTSTAERFVRIFILQWHDQVGTFSASNVLLDGTTGATSIESQRNHDEASRFTVLYEKTHIIGCTTTTANSTHSTTIFKKLNIKIKRPKIQFIAAGTTYLSNGLYFCAFTDSATTPPNISFQSLVTYTD